MLFQFASFNHISFFRKENQDREGIFYNKNGEILLVLCDGMGGHIGGKQASNLAIKKISEEFYASNFLDYNSDVIKNWCVNAVDKVQQYLLEFSIKEQKLDSMGTTLVACLILKNNVGYIINIGDSRAYFCNKKKIIQLTEDQNLSNLLAKNDDLNKGAPKVKTSLGNALYSALGPSKQMHIDIFSFNLKPGTLVLCSDGLYGFVNKERIHFVCIRSISAQQKATTLINEALKNNTKDNSTVIIADIIEPNPHD